MPGGFLSISANRVAQGATKDRGILWAALPYTTTRGSMSFQAALRAFEIRKDGSVIKSLWTSHCAEQKVSSTTGKTSRRPSRTDTSLGDVLRHHPHLRIAQSQ